MPEQVPQIISMSPTKDLPCSPPLVVHEVAAAPAFGLRTSDQYRDSSISPGNLEGDLPSLESTSTVQDTRLGSRWHALGSLTSRGNVAIAGGFDGKLSVLRHTAGVTLSQGSLCECDITAKHMRLLGTYKGTATAPGGWIGVGATAQIQGTLAYSELSMGGGNHNAKLIPLPTPLAMSVPNAARRLEESPTAEHNPSADTSSLGADCVFKGDLVCDTSACDTSSWILDVHGFVEGNIVTGEGGSICIAAGGSVRGNRLVADHVIIRGWVSVQRLVARHSLIIEESATVLGSIEYGGSITLTGTPKFMCSLKQVPVNAHT